jgi:ribonuclease HI
MNQKSQVVVFTDGASKGNPGPGGYAAILLSREENGGESNVQCQTFQVVELGGRVEHTTNNRMELTATIEALSFLRSNVKGQLSIVIYCDSSYVISGITKWIFGWQKNNWTTKTKEEVLNKDLWQKLLALVSGREIDWQYVGGHVGIAGNERCDEIATAFAEGKTPPLYSGVLKNYRIKNILDTTADGASYKKKKRDSARGRAKAHSYVSKVDGVIEIHKTWAECERRVRGKSGALFKKALNASEEKSILESFKIGKGDYI